jgi:hypothetical protein
MMVAKFLLHVFLLKCWFFVASRKPVTLALDEKHREEYETASDKTRETLRKQAGGKVIEKWTKQPSSQSAKEFCEMPSSVIGHHSQSREAPNGV